MTIWTQYLTLKLAVRLCLDAYHSEEEPGQFLYAAMQCLENRLNDLNSAPRLTAEEHAALVDREEHLQHIMEKTRQELGYSVRS
jgi:hypothetical protein